MVDISPPLAEAQGSPVVEGASVDPVYTRRKMKMYPISESEISIISTMNAQATIYFSLASFLGSSAVGIFTNAAFYSELTAAGQVARNIAAPGLMFLTIGFITLGMVSLRSRRNIWEEVRKESVVEET